MSELSQVHQRLDSVRERIAQACLDSGRSTADVRLVAVSKRQPLERIAAALEAGQLDLGESYAQELVIKRERFPGVRWHFIGHLQRNKVKYVVPGCSLLHSVDSLRLLQAVSRRAEASGLVQELLLELGTGEASKTGAASAELFELAEACVASPSVRLLGLMGMAPWGSAASEARRTFARIRALRDSLQDRLGTSLPELSMGMSGDLEQAVMEGATLVRVGEAVFGPRQ